MQNAECAFFSFRIASIENGWLFAEVELAGRQMELANSCLGGLELPGALVSICNAFLSGEKGSRWLCWHGESHALIWHVRNVGGQLCLETYTCGSSLGLPVCGECLADKVQSLAPDTAAHIDTVAFAQAIYQAFKEYRFGDRLEQWQRSEFKDYFPEAEYHALRRLLRSKTEYKRE